MKVILASVISMFLFCATPNAGDWVTDSHFAVAPVSSADWIRDRKSGDPERLNRDAIWMFGFLSALVRAKGPISGGGMTAEDFPDEIDELCAAHPEWNTPQILEIFA